MRPRNETKRNENDRINKFYYNEIMNVKNTLLVIRLIDNLQNRRWSECCECLCNFAYICYKIFIIIITFIIY